MNFITAFDNETKKAKTLTENGAVVYETSGSSLLDLNFATSSMRMWSEDKIVHAFEKAYFECPVLAVVWLFFLRDVRGCGMGERRSFRICMKWLCDNRPDDAKKIISLIPEYGRWDDLIYLTNSNLKNNIIKIIDNQLEKDMDDCMNNKPVSLLAKWLPSINASSYKTKNLAKIICKELGIKEVQYRKILSKMRKYIDIVERKMSSKDWNEINYNTVPSVANLKYSNAFLKNDNNRRKEYLDNLAKGNPETKINAKTLFPSDIVGQYNYPWCNYDETKEQLWKALPNFVEDDSNTIVVRDGSGSMTVSIPGTKTRCIDVSTALAIYFSERNSGEFKNKFITFSSNPKVVNLENCKSLFEKLSLCRKYTDCTNTNIEKVFDMILEAAINNELSQEELPKNIIIVSDMEFDSMCEVNNNTKTIFENIKYRYEAHGYKLPKLIFWNVLSRTNGIPLRENELGVALVSGFSPAIYNMVLSNKTNPFDCLVEQLNNERYNPVWEALLLNK